MCVCVCVKERQLKNIFLMGENFCFLVGLNMIFSLLFALVFPML